MKAYDKQSLTFGNYLVSQGLPVLAVTKVGKAFHVKLPVDCQQTVVQSVTLKGNLRFVSVKETKALDGKPELTAYYAPIV